ncbi:hypothetical protein SAMN05421786_11551 [Chryseobacterium ureilyticum]|uniref:LysM domain-containing protein n=1 Tax=Chryseobacterium ureilyticum TaxID=373668 RepID=A0A1N7QS05_9FLAO|nr:hypothetical protein [Chryseobacterium ureilyticum]SIT25663.1 hypothetical protein SAMN05421786_11551 [Chryseobacterium ureilyticum]
MEVTIRNNQSLLDIAIQYTGNIGNSVYIAKFNNLAPSEQLSSGTVIKIPDDIVIEKTMVDYFKIRQHPPIATRSSNEVQIKPLEGINYWEIEETFEVQ